MGIALAQSIPTIASNNSATALSSNSLASNPTVSNYITFWAWGWNSSGHATVPTVSDTGGNSYTTYFQNRSGDAWALCGWAKVGTSAATFKVSLATGTGWSAGAMDIVIAEWSGVVGTSAVDGTPIGTTGTTGSPAPGSMTITAGSLVCGVMVRDDTAYVGSTPSGFTRAGFQNNGSTNEVGEAIYAIGPTSPSNPTWGNSTNAWAAQQFALLAAAAAANPEGWEDGDSLLLRNLRAENRFVIPY